MKTLSSTWTPAEGFSPGARAAQDAQLALYFGSRRSLDDPRCFVALRAAFPQAILLGCSTGGHLNGEDICDDLVCVATVSFRDARLRSASAEIPSPESSRAAGEALANALDAPDLAAVIALSDGLSTSGAELLAGMTARFGRDVPICGGMAGDGADFQRTLVGLDRQPTPGVAAAVGLYGASLTIGCGCEGGWRVFGPQRMMSRSHGAVLEELDGRPALELYTRYLDPRDIAGLPGAALLFPLMVRNPAGRQENVVRTVLGVDRAKGSLTFAGDMPRGWGAQLMRGSIPNLARGAEEAGAMAARPLAGAGDSGAQGLALLVSCIARRLVMGPHAAYEIDAVQSQLPEGMQMAGFYSYGGFAPHARTRSCVLHNQTMIVMTIVEAAA